MGGEKKTVFLSGSGCYGVTRDEAEQDDWLCARCKADATLEVGVPGFQLFIDGGC